MKPRIEKKLSKKIVDLNIPSIRSAWLDKDFNGWGYRQLRKDLKKLSAKELRNHYDSRSTIQNVWVMGGKPDYWGEATEVETVFICATDYLYWEYGEIGEYSRLYGKKRITGKLVMQLLKGQKP